MIPVTLESVPRGVQAFWDRSSGEFISALAGAFLGACAAYYFQNATEKKKELSARQGAIVRAQMALASMMNSLQNMELQFVKPLRESGGRADKFGLFYQAHAHLKVDFDSLAFLLLTKFSNVVQNVYLAERCYVTSYEAIDIRNEAFQTLRKNSDVAKMDPMTGECVVRGDPRDIRALELATRAFCESVPDSLARCGTAFSELRNAGKSLYPTTSFLNYKILAATEHSAGRTEPAKANEDYSMKNKTCHEWSRHYDIIQWTVGGLLLSAIGALYVYSLDHNSAETVFIASCLLLVNCFFTSSFRALRSRVHHQFTVDEWDWVKGIITNSGFLKQGRINVLIQAFIFLGLLHRLWIMRPEFHFGIVCWGAIGVIIGAVCYWKAKAAERV